MAHYKTLKAWKYSMRLAVQCSQAARRFPHYEQQKGLADQLRRAAYSIPINIAEGSARRGSREYRRFLDTAWSSHAEVDTAIELAKDLGYITMVEYARLDALADETGKMLFGLLRKVTNASGPARDGAAKRKPRGS